MATNSTSTIFKELCTTLRVVAGKFGKSVKPPVAPMALITPNLYAQMRLLLDKIALEVEDGEPVKNPDNLPLDKLKITITREGVERIIPALDPFWVEKRKLTLYTKPFQNILSPGDDLYSWKQKTETYLHELFWMLSLNHHKFWSNIVYQPKCIETLVSFLQASNPPYFRLQKDKMAIELYNCVYEKVFIIFTRMITEEEGKGKWMEKDFLGSLIYDKGIFTIPVLFDLCLLYGGNNKYRMTEVINNVFTLQPKYYDDLSMIIPFLQKVLLTVSSKFDMSVTMNIPDSIKILDGFGGLHRQNSLRLKDNQLTVDAVDDMILYLLDASITIKTILDLHSPARKLFRDRDFHISIVDFYENIIPKMHQKIHEHSQNAGLIEEIYEHLDKIRGELINIYRMIINTTIEDILLEKEIEKNTENYLAIIGHAMADRAFFRDYNMVYPIKGDLDILIQTSSNMDEAKRDMILQALLNDGIDLPALTKQIKTETSSPSGSTEAGSETEASLSESQNQRLREIKEIFPELGNGFVLQCLITYDNDVEAVIHNILEGTLHESLIRLDPHLPIVPNRYPSAQSTKGSKATTQSKRCVDMLDEAYDDYSMLSEEDEESEDPLEELYDQAVRDALAESDDAKALPLIDELAGSSYLEIENPIALIEENPKKFFLKPEMLREMYQPKCDLKFDHRSTESVFEPKCSKSFKHEQKNKAQRDYKDKDQDKAKTKDKGKGKGKDKGQGKGGQSSKMGARCRNNNEDVSM